MFVSFITNSGLFYGEKGDDGVRTLESALAAGSWQKNSENSELIYCTRPLMLIIGVIHYKTLTKNSKMNTCPEVNTCPFCKEEHEGLCSIVSGIACIVNGISPDEISGEEILNEMEYDDDAMGYTDAAANEEAANAEADAMDNADVNATDNVEAEATEDADAGIAAPSGEGRLRKIVQLLKSNNAIKRYHGIDLSKCTKQTSEMANQNERDDVEETNDGGGDNIDATSKAKIDVPDDEEGGDTYVSPYTLIELIAITIMFASTYEKATTEEGKKANKKNYLWPFYLFLCGAENIEIPTFFPSPNAKEWGDNNSGDANYLDGCLYSILKQAMPLAMMELISGVDSYPSDIVAAMLLEFYVCGYVCADGSYAGYFDGSSPAKCSIAIHAGDLPVPFVELLKRDLKFTYNKSHAERRLNRDTLYESYWPIASHLCSTIKRLQVSIIMKSSAVTKMARGGTSSSSSLNKARMVQTNLLSAANNKHGRYDEYERTFEYYQRLFTTMIESSHKLVFNVSSAGMIAGDGGVGYALRDCKLFQSCEPYMKAFAGASRQALRLDEEPSVRNTSGASLTTTNTSAKFEVNFNKWQSVFCILYFGSFDYRRRCQWIVFLLGVLIKQSPLFASKTNVLEFLEDLIVVTRKEEKS